MHWKLLSSLLHCCASSCLIASTFFGSILMLPRVRSCPKTLHSPVLNSILSGSNFRLLSWAVSSRLRTAMSRFITLSPLADTLSAMPVTPGTISMTASSLSWKPFELTNRKNGSYNNLNFSQCVLNAVNSELFFLIRPSSSLTWHP